MSKFSCNRSTIGGLTYSATPPVQRHGNTHKSLRGIKENNQGQKRISDHDGSWERCNTSASCVLCLLLHCRCWSTILGVTWIDKLPTTGEALAARPHYAATPHHHTAKLPTAVKLPDPHTPRLPLLLPPPLCYLRPQSRTIPQAVKSVSKSTPNRV